MICTVGRILLGRSKQGGWVNGACSMNDGGEIVEASNTCDGDETGGACNRGQ